VRCRTAASCGSADGLGADGPDPLGSEVVIATPAIQSQFGIRLATVYAPQVLASFGSGPEQVVVRYIAPDGAAAFNAQLAKARQDRISAGRLLLEIAISTPIRPPAPSFSEVKSTRACLPRLHNLRTK